MRLLIRLAISAAVIFGVAYFSNGTLLEVDGWVAAALAAVVMAIVNSVIRPIVHLLALPITIITLGLFALVVNLAMFYLVAAIVPGVETTGLLNTIIAAIIIAVITSVLTSLIEGND